jgi:hypothetical protein
MCSTCRSFASIRGRSSASRSAKADKARPVQRPTYRVRPQPFDMQSNAERPPRRRAVPGHLSCPGGQYPVIGIEPDPTRVVRLDIEKAILRALTPPSRRAAPLPPQATPPAQETREQWRQRLFDEMRSYCTKWPDDTACGPNPLSGGSEDRRTAQGVGAARLKPSHGQNNLSQRRHIDRSQESAGHILYSAEAKSLRGPRR